MDKEFYNLAVKLMNNIRQLEPNLVAARDAELCVLMTENEQIYAGITGIKISAGQLMRACPEYNAIMAMIPEGESRVAKLITVSFAGHAVSQPCEGCLELLCRVDPDNRNTEIYVAANHAVPASALMPKLAENNEAPEVTVPPRAAKPAEETFDVDAAAVEEEAIEAAEAIPATAEEISAAAAEKAAAEAEAAANAAGEAAAAIVEAATAVSAVNEFANEFAEEAAAPSPAVQIPSLEEDDDDEDDGEVEVLASPAAKQDPEEVNEFAQFGFEEAEAETEVPVLQPNADNPFYEPPLDPAAAAAQADLPKFMQNPQAQAPRVMNPNGYPQQSGYQQSGYMGQQPQSGYMGQQGGSLYANQPLPGQQQAGPQFTPNGGYPQQPFQPSQPFQTQGQYPQQSSHYPQAQQPYPQYQPSQQFQPNPQYQSQQFQPNPQLQSQQFQPNPSYSSQHNSQYASQPLPGQSMTASVPLPGSGTSAQPAGDPAQPQTEKKAGSAFQQRLNAFVDDGAKSDKPLTPAEMLRQAKEKKKMAKIDADFKKKMRKKGGI